MIKKFGNKELEPLYELGLNNTQATIYLSLLKHGIQSVLELSKITGINRQQIYDGAEILLKRGLLEVTRKNRRKYIAVNPHKLAKISKENIHKAERVHEKISEAIPILELVPTSNKRNPKILYFEGLNQLKAAYSKELEESYNTEILSFAGSIDDVYNFFPESYWSKWNKDLVKQKSSSRMLVHKSKVAAQSSVFDKEYKRQTRYLNYFPLKVNIDVFNNTVLIVSFYDELAIWIESDMIANSYRTMFELFWASGSAF
ncbi:MAG TPA: helix-turn-helix domain-containing protein [Candidatus Paceibacterota bacterium]|nr:helix-turn-helix domain-containing protein [Candidatus Paceibacterota bacterium]